MKIWFTAFANIFDINFDNFNSIELNNSKISIRLKCSLIKAIAI